MFQRQTEGSVVCPSCRLLVGVNDEVCYHCGRRNPGMWGYAKLFQALGMDLGFTPFVLYGCILMYLLTLAYDPRGISMGGIFNLFSPSSTSSIVFGASGAYPVFALGRWWTVLSASFLHGGLLHIGFNMMWVRNLLPVTTDIYGPSRAVLIYTVSSILGFGASSVMGTGLTLGASAAIFGLLGALVRSGSSIGQQAKMFAVMMFIFGFLMPGIDNWAHAGGFLGGYLSARVLDPYRESSQIHLMLALGCIAAFVLSILVSFFHAQQFLP